MLAKVFPIKLKDGNQSKAEEVVLAYGPQGPGQEEELGDLMVEFVEVDHELLISL
ncbi:hypothetical protein [Kribbella catacumbae]|uniref:hypothetical protein n=1 Tax=Kribbella catacumbae TaxID=460086 RepID=UPI000379C021|nr:hypothetical protein [Kribbella catacumbae]